MQIKITHPVSDATYTFYFQGYIQPGEPQTMWHPGSLPEFNLDYIALEAIEDDKFSPRMDEENSPELFPQLEAEWPDFWVDVEIAATKAIYSAFDYPEVE